MNIEMIKAFKEEFDHFIKNGKDSIIACEKKYVERDGWNVTAYLLFESITLNPEDYLIVKNDKYVELRKEAALGKQMQVSYDNGKNWHDKLTRKITWSDSQLVRVKPEPFLEVGNWFNAAAKIHQVKEIIEGKTRTYKSDDGCLYDRFISKWNPEPGDYCFFHNGDKNFLVFGQFIKMENELFNARQLCKDVLIQSIDPELFKYCEPLRGKIPQILKED